MRKLFAMLLLTAVLFAAAGFWQRLVEIEKQFYSLDTLDRTIVKRLQDKADTNRTAEGNGTRQDIDAVKSKLADATSKYIEEKYDAFNDLIRILKERPYSVQRTDNPFFNPAEADKRLFKLRSRININRQYGYKLAVERDRIAIETIQLKQRIFVFFASVAAEWTEIDEAKLRTLIDEQKRALDKIPINTYEKQYLHLADDGSDLYRQLKKNLQQLRSNYYFYSEILNYLDLNPSILHYQSLIQKLKLGSLITLINESDTAEEINIALRYVHLDIGRLVLFLITLLLAWLASRFTYSTVHTFFRWVILRKKDRFDEIFLNSLDSIRKPLSLLVFVFGLKIAFDLLTYPEEPVKDSLVFYFIILTIISYILMLIIDNTLLTFLLERADKKNRTMRSELVNLLISVIKFIIILVAVLLFLVRAGIDISGILASLGIGGLAIALAAKETLSNFFGLIKIIADNSFSQGDWIEADGVEGTVVEIGFISTDIRTFDNALITVPNEKLANVPLKNWNRRSVGRRIKMHIGVTYGSKREALHEAIEEIRQMLIDHPGIASPETIDKNNILNAWRQERKLLKSEDKYGIKSTLLVYLDELADSSMNILVYCFSKTTDWARWLAVKEDVIFKIWEILDKHGLEFAFPSQSLYFDKENIETSVGTLLTRPENPAKKNDS